MRTKKYQKIQENASTTLMYERKNAISKRKGEKELEEVVFSEQPLFQD